MATLTAQRPLPRRLAFPALPILDGYVLREILGPFAFALSAYLIFWALNIFFLAADYIINEHAPFFLVLRFVVFRIPQAVPMAFPFATLFAGLLAMGRLMGDNEVVAMRTSGISLARIAATPLLFG
ncbi:MAG: LptF/LptG family permease, partial [Candidatus Eremiobacteraeota bacterium]|nr:LptF/LptG family permease [Candidatus Eremiobacteraeota bacterium]